MFGRSLLETRWDGDVDLLKREFVSRQIRLAFLQGLWNVVCTFNDRVQEEEKTMTKECSGKCWLWDPKKRDPENWVTLVSVCPVATKYLELEVLVLGALPEGHSLRLQAFRSLLQYFHKNVQFLAFFFVVVLCWLLPCSCFEEFYSVCYMVCCFVICYCYFTFGAIFSELNVFTQPFYLRHSLWGLSCVTAVCFWFLVAWT